MLDALSQRISTYRGRLLAVDPGETTGWALFVDGRFVKWGQLDTASNLQRASKLILATRPDRVVIERFALYGWKRKQQTGSTFPTVEAIGVLKATAQGKSIPVTLQSAAQAKRLITDKRLKDLRLWLPGQRHARDAMRHALYYALTKR